ncbi:hypothetical protein KVR01_002709 [Diaporthe batatas]|uniref:uncharacterized protein n=1 Tax=Diaporthe batatas TaxID=748121 RepID=UPI001D041714|nr:uncharacterized protein KVR01_002709 [Diaporthe batatas]KAG8167020.1 hypothetical protein KVR01_002709 [Diaporthe batatas]
MPERPLGDHPIYAHSELCGGVHEKVDQILDISNLHTLKFNFDRDLDLGDHKALLKYKDIEQYPHGVADAVGYWAEAQIFGGVILFDRRRQIDAWENLLDPDKWEHFEWLLSQYRALQQPLQDPYEIYFHSNHRAVTYRIWQLLPEQRKDLFEFLLSDMEGITSPLPILPGEKNLFRIDPEDPISETGICRDVWERKPLGDDDGDARAHHCRGDKVEYPCPTDEERSKGRGFFRKELIFEITLLEVRARKLAMSRGCQGPQSDSPSSQH